MGGARSNWGGSCIRSRRVEGEATSEVGGTSIVQSNRSRGGGGFKSSWGRSGARLDWIRILKLELVEPHLMTDWFLALPKLIACEGDRGSRIFQRFLAGGFIVFEPFLHICNKIEVSLLKEVLCGENYYFLTVLTESQEN